MKYWGKITKEIMLGACIIAGSYSLGKFSGRVYFEKKLEKMERDRNPQNTKKYKT